MKMFARIFFACLLFFCLNFQNSQAKVNDLILDFDKVKKKMPFKKKQPEAKPKMVETKQEWEFEASNIPLEERKLEKQEPPKTDKKNYYPKIHYVFEKYNYPAGTRELNIENIKKNLVEYPIIVADKDCKYVAYSQYYFSPNLNQITSNFYVEKLDTSKNKTKRILDFNHKQIERIPIIQAGTKENYPNLFQGLTLVDWSNDSKKLLIKEKIGSTINGIYKTKLYVYFNENDVESGYLLKLDDFDSTIKNYFIDYQNLQLVKYRYDITPLGFSEENDDIILAHCFAYDKDNKKLFLGLWGYNTKTYEVMLISKNKPEAFLSSNGLILRRVLD